MTPREKAKEIFDTIYDLIDHEAESAATSCNGATKEIALFCVNELINHTRSIDGMPPNFGAPNESCREFWVDVKKEIEAGSHHQSSSTTTHANTSISDVSVNVKITYKLRGEEEI